MSSGHIRYGEEERIPLSPPIWMMEVSVSETGIKEEVLHFNKTDMSELVNRLKSADKENRYYIVWHGQYNTDVFQVDPLKIARRIEAEYFTSYSIKV